MLGHTPPTPDAHSATTPQSRDLTIRDAIALLDVLERSCPNPRLVIFDRATSQPRTVADLELRLALNSGLRPDSPIGPLMETSSDADPSAAFDASSVFAVVMAGGKGTRLMPLTQRIPKPMLRVGERPVLELMLRSLNSVGITRAAIVVRYRHRCIVEYFTDCPIPGMEITFVREPFPMGTAGALGMLAARVGNASTILVLNGDILTTLSFRSLLRFHMHLRMGATVCTRPYCVLIPFGVPVCHEGRLVGFEEKPLKTFHINSGIYCLPASILSDIPTRIHLDMPDILQRMLTQGVSIATFPLVDPYHEIGTIESYRAASAFYRAHDQVFDAAFVE